MSAADKRKLVWLLSAAAALVVIIAVLMLISNGLAKPSLPDGLPEFPGECREISKGIYGGVTAYYDGVDGEMFDGFIKANPEYADYSQKYDGFTAAIAYDTQNKVFTVTTIPD